MPVILLQQVPPSLPAVLVRDLVKALSEAALGGRSLSAAWNPAFAEMNRMVRKRPEGDPERVFLDGLRAAAMGRAAEPAWASAVKPLHQTLRTLGEGSSEALRLWEYLADLQVAQGLPDYPWRDRALAARLERSRGVDDVLEADLLKSLKDHWGGFMEPPRRSQTLARCSDLAGLWLRRPVKERARVMGRVAFEEHAGNLWGFAFREGDNDLRARLHECLAELPPRDLLAALEEHSFLAWVVAGQNGGLAEEVQSLVQRLDPYIEGRWGFGARAALLRSAWLLQPYMALLAEGLERLPLEARRDLLRKELLNCPKMDPTLGRRAQERLMEDPVLRADAALRGAWVTRLLDLGMETEAQALQGSEPEPENKPKMESAADLGEDDPKVRGLLGSEAELALLRAYESGRMDEAEALVWPVLEKLARGEEPELLIEPKNSFVSRAEELSMLPSLLVEPWLRRRAPEEAMVRLERLESLLLKVGTGSPLEVTKGLPSLRRRVERQRRLLGLLGAAADP